MPLRIDPSTVSITRNDGHTADITDNLMIWDLLASNESMEKGATKVLRWTAKIINQTGIVAPTSKLSDMAPAASAVFKGHKVYFTCRNIPAGNMTVSVINSAGKKIYRTHACSIGAQQQTVVIPLRCSAGIYYMLLENGRVALKEKIVIGQ